MVGACGYVGPVWSLQPQQKPDVNGGSGRNRTGVDGFAIRCITTLPPSHREPRVLETARIIEKQLRRGSRGVYAW